MRGLALSIMLLSLSARGEDGFLRLRTAQNACLVWPKSTYRYHLWSGFTEPEKAAFERSVSSWRELADGCNGFTFERLTDTDTESIVGSPTNVILRRDQTCELIPDDDDCQRDPNTAHAQCGSRYRCWFLTPATGSGTLGLTTHTFNPRTGQINRADIEMNSSLVEFADCNKGIDCSNKYDAQNMFTHELGHVVGLAHFPEPSTMGTHAPTGEIAKRIIDDGSAYGFCAIYPRGLPPLPCDDTAQIKQGLSVQISGQSAGCGCTQVAGAFPFALALLLIRRKRPSYR